MIISNNQNTLIGGYALFGPNGNIIEISINDQSLQRLIQIKQILSRHTIQTDLVTFDQNEFHELANQVEKDDSPTYHFTYDYDRYYQDQLDPSL